MPAGKSSISTEVAYSRHRPLDRDTMLERTIASLQAARASSTTDDEIELVHAEEILPAYVIYDLEHGRNVATIRDGSRSSASGRPGRFGEWQYFNMDHSMKSGQSGGGGDPRRRLGLSSTRLCVTRRELLLLVPLLALYLAAWAFFPDRPDDEASYVALAERLADGWYVTGDDDALLDARPDSPDLWFGPGLPGMLAPFAFVDAPRVGDASDGAAAPLRRDPALLRRSARATWGSRVGLLSAYALGLYLPFLGLVSNLHSEVLAVFFVCAAMLGLARYLRAGGFRWLALASVSLAGLALTRVAYGWVLTLVLVLFVLAWLVRRRRA